MILLIARNEWHSGSAIINIYDIDERGGGLLILHPVLQHSLVHVEGGKVPSRGYNLNRWYVLGNLFKKLFNFSDQLLTSMYTFSAIWYNLIKELAEDLRLFTRIKKSAH